MEHKLLHLSKRRSRGDLIMVHKYLCEIKNTMCPKFGVLLLLLLGFLFLFFFKS